MEQKKKTYGQKASPAVEAPAEDTVKVRSLRLSDDTVEELNAAKKALDVRTMDEAMQALLDSFSIKFYFVRIFAIPAIADDKSLAFMDGMTLDEKIHAVESNSNIRVSIALHLEGYIRSGAAGDEEYSEKQEIIHPLTFDDWNAHEDFYMAILKEDAKALERYDAGEGEEE